jgi:glycosyltransferase involved in cell wall biosynthesis
VKVVCLFRSSCHLGGIERQLLDHAVRLAADGWTPHLLCLYRGGGDSRDRKDHPLVDAARQAGLSAATIADPGPFRPGVFAQVRARVDPLQPAILHTCDYRSDLFGMFLRGWTSEPRRVWVTESHGHTAETRRMAVWNAIDRWALRRADAVAAVSAAWETSLAAAGVEPARLHTVGNSIAILAPDPVPALLRLPQGRHLLYAGRLSPEKGLDMLLEVWSAVTAAHPDLHLWVLGATARSASYRRRLAPLLAQPGVHAVGFHDDIRPWLQAMDAVVVPSRQEVWGMTAFEALAAGVPVVAARTGGLPHVCEDARHALLVTPLTPGALVDGIDRVLDASFPRGADLGEAYRHRPRFDPARRHQRLLDLYRSQLEQ